MENNNLIVYNIAWAAKWVGVVVIILCWIQVVPLRIGWIGFGVAFLSYIVEAICKKKMIPPETEGSPEEQSESSVNET